MSIKFAAVHDRYSSGEIAAYYESGFWASTTFNQLAAEQARARPGQLFIFDSTTSSPSCR